MKYLLSILVILVAYIPSSQAGQCIKQGINLETIQKTDYIFIATTNLDKVTNKKDNSHDSSPKAKPDEEETVTDVVAVIKRFKGENIEDVVTIKQHYYHALSINHDKTYIIFASKNANGIYVTNGCSPSRAINKSDNIELPIEAWINDKAPFQ
jgi:hypothetical protein